MGFGFVDGDTNFRGAEDIFAGNNSGLEFFENADYDTWRFAGLSSFHKCFRFLIDLFGVHDDGCRVFGGLGVWE